MCSWPLQVNIFPCKKFGGDLQAIYNMFGSLPHKTAIAEFNNVVVTQEDATLLLVRIKVCPCKWAISNNCV